MAQFKPKVMLDFLREDGHRTIEALVLPGKGLIMAGTRNSQHCSTTKHHYKVETEQHAWALEQRFESELERDNFCSPFRGYNKQ